MSKVKWSVGLAGAFLSAGLLCASPGLAATTGSSGSAGASGTISTTTNGKGSGFLQSKLALEMALAKRQAQLVHLTAEVSGAVNLTVSDKATLSSRLSTETSNINALIVKVPGDTTWAELHADSNAMYRDNRVFAVMTPQSHDSIVADNNMAMSMTLQANEATMGSAITARASDPGYAAAMHQYGQYVKATADVHTNSMNVDTLVLAQSPAGYPKNVHIFNQAAKDLAAEQNSLGTASSDGAQIDLFIEAYPVA